MASRLFHAARVTIVEDGHEDRIALGLFVNLEGSMLRPRPVEVTFTLGVLAFMGLPSLINWRQTPLLAKSPFQTFSR